MRRRGGIEGPDRSFEILHLPHLKAGIWELKAKWGRGSFLGLSCDRVNLLLTLLDSCLAQAWKTNNKHFFVGKEIFFFKCLSIVPFCSI